MHNSQQSRRRVAELRAAHPEWTLADIAWEVGVTRERVRQLLVALGLPTTAIKLDG
jgi:DNA-directed RNA polymerase sigma subunit (sigma70/sigma32)